MLRAGWRAAAQPGLVVPFLSECRRRTQFHPRCAARLCHDDLVAQWYELAIPAAATLLGGVTGAWFQSRTTERQMEIQTKAASAEQANVNRREERARFFTERRQAYAQLGEAGYALATVAHELFADYTQMGLGWIAEPVDEEQHKVKLAKYDATWETFRVAVIAVEVVGTDTAAKLAREMERTLTDVANMLPSTAPLDEPARERLMNAVNMLDDLRGKFLEQARRDLEPTEESKPEAESSDR